MAGDDRGGRDDPVERIAVRPVERGGDLGDLAVNHCDLPAHPGDDGDRFVPIGFHFRPFAGAQLLPDFIKADRADDHHVNRVNHLDDI